MRNLTLILLIIASTNVYCQQNNLEFGKYRLWKYHWLYIGYSPFQLENWRSSFGLGLNITQIYNLDKTKSLTYYPKSNIFFENFNVYANVEKEIFDKHKNISFFIYNRLNIGRSSFYLTHVGNNGDTLNISYSYTDPKWLIDYNIGVGFQAKVFDKITFYTKIACATSTQNIFSFSNDYGLIFNLKKREN